MKAVRRQPRKHFHSSGVGSMLGQLTGLGSRGRHSHEANFSRILPSTMLKLVEDGLFVPDGQGSYKITKLGLQKLKEFEDSQ